MRWVAYIYLLLMVVLAAGCKTNLEWTSSMADDPSASPAMRGLFFSSFLNENNVAFATQVDCHIGCQGSEPEETSVGGTYDPKKRGLKPGNGNLWGSLGNDLHHFAVEVCVAEAKSRCKTFSKITSFEVAGIRSGDWSMPVPVPCFPDSPILSPYDDDVAVEFTESELSVKNWVPPYLDPKVLSSTSCKKWLTARRCYGDCMVEMGSIGNWRQTLAAKPYALDDTKICADALVDLFMNEGINSPDLQLELCRDFASYMNAHERSEKIELACAAYRLEVDCSPLFASSKEKAQ